MSLSLLRYTAIGVLLARSLAPLSAEDEPVKRPTLDVTAKIPLLKVGEYQMVRKRFAPAVVADGDYIYIIGGIDDHRNLLGSIERFDTRTGRSEEFAMLKVARFWHRAVLANGKIYVLGGRSEHAPNGSESVPAVTAVEVLRSSSPEARINAKVEANRAAVSGATANWSPSDDPITDFENSVEILDLASRQISWGPKLPDARDQFACAVVDQQLFVLGGRHRHGNGSSISNTTLVLNLASGQWIAGIPMPTARVTDAVVVTGPFIVVPGGYDGQNARTEVEAFNPSTQTWATVPPLCRATSAQTSAFLGHYLFLFGDYEHPNEILAYDLATKRSETFTLQYHRARHGAAAVHDGKIYVFGGRERKEVEPIDTIQVFAPPPKKSTVASAAPATTE
ncbi:MAG TPA: hypothetical protein VFJ90_14320 [Candidatus Didemnitutus sp.]|nr:hypothetical protein [Candidatus Didemnitutus sp.]